MKLMKLMAAQAALEAMTKKRLKNYAAARKLAALRKRVSEEAEFYTEEQRKAVLSYAELDKDGNPVFLDGSYIKLKSPEAKAEFDGAMRLLNETELEIEPVTLTEADFADDLPTPEEMFALDGLIAFA